jgi:alpha-tubulin suppressor-like RCC1 family protein
MPVVAAGLTDVVEVVALDWSTCARDRAGTVTCWGMGDKGQLGDGVDNRLQPGPPVALPRPAIALTAGENHACALTDDGCAWCWGANQRGQLGNGRDDGGEALRPVLLSCW